MRAYAAGLHQLSNLAFYVHLVQNVHELPLTVVHQFTQSIKSHKDAGALSRLSIKSNEHDDPDASDTFNTEQNLSVTVEMAGETKRNPMLSCV